MSRILGKEGENPVNITYVMVNLNTNENNVLTKNLSEKRRINTSHKNLEKRVFGFEYTDVQTSKRFNF